MANSSTEIRAGFFDSVDGDRKYYASDMIMPYSRLVCEGIYGTDNTSEVGTDFNMTVASTTQIIIATGQGILNGRWFQLEADLPIDIDVNGTLSNRVDSVFICCDNTSGTRAVSIEYMVGTGQTAPTVEDSTYVKYLRLCDLTVAPSSQGGGITITDQRGTSECPIITGLIQQLSVDDFLTQFRSTFNNWYDSIVSQWDTYYSSTGATWDAYFDSVKTAWDSKLLEVQNQWDTYYSSVGTQWTAKLAEVEAEWEEWMDIVRSGALIAVIQTRVEYDGTTAPTISNYSAVTDQVIVYLNGFYLAPTYEYTIDSTGAITFVNEINAGGIVDIVVYRASADSSGS